MLALQAGPVLFRTSYERWLDTDVELDSRHMIGAVLADQRAIVTGQSSRTGAIANVARSRALLRCNFATNFPDSLASRRLRLYT